jgi:O-antigen ligase
MRFFLFIVANALLFIRPSEFIPDLYAVELYRYAIIACFAVSFPVVLQQFVTRFAGVPPIGACVLLLLPAVFLSGLSHGNTDMMQDTVIEFAKVVVYFLLLISLLTDAAKLRQFLGWIGVFCAAVTLIAVLRYHADVAVPAAPKMLGQTKSPHFGTYVVDQVRDASTGQLVVVQRMCGTGIFNDPNDFALLLVTAIPLCLYWLTDPTKKSMRPFWLMILVLCGYALMLTQSRGGFIAMVAGLLVLFYLKFGAVRTMLLGALAMPVLLAVFAGRMTNISTEDGTGQSRLQLWAEAFTLIQQSPLIGIGADNYRAFSRHVAHNSFIHCYAEMGLIGGSLFVSAFFLALRGLYEFRRQPGIAASDSPIDPELQRMHPFLLAMLVAYAVGICFLSRSYIVPTYMMLGLAVVYLRLRATPETISAPVWTRFIWPKLAGVSGCFLVATYMFVRTFAK